MHKIQSHEMKTIFVQALKALQSKSNMTVAFQKNKAAQRFLSKPRPSLIWVQATLAEKHVQLV